MASFKVTLLFILSVVWTVLADEAADPEPEEFLTVEVGTDGEQTVYPVGDTGFDIMEMEIAFKKKFLDDEVEAVYKRYGEIVYELLDEQKIPASTSPDGQEPMLKANGWNTMTQKIVEEQRFARSRIADIEMELRIIEEEFGPIESIQQMADRHGDLEYDIVQMEAFFVKKFLNAEWDAVYKRYGEIKEEQRALEEGRAPDFFSSHEHDPKTQAMDWRVRTQKLMAQQRFVRTRLANIETELQILDGKYGFIPSVDEQQDGTSRRRMATEIQVFIRNLDGKPVPITVSSDAIVADLYTESNSRGLRPTQLNLGAQALNDLSSKLADSGISSEAVLHVSPANWFAFGNIWTQRRLLRAKPVLDMKIDPMGKSKGKRPASGYYVYESQDDDGLNFYKVDPTTYKKGSSVLGITKSAFKFKKPGDTLPITIHETTFTVTIQHLGFF